jgi:hypothetical protein
MSNNLSRREIPQDDCEWIETNTLELLLPEKAGTKTDIEIKAFVHCQSDWSHDEQHGRGKYCVADETTILIESMLLSESCHCPTMMMFPFEEEHLTIACHVAPRTRVAYLQRGPKSSLVCVFDLTASLELPFVDVTKCSHFALAHSQRDKSCRTLPCVR